MSTTEAPPGVAMVTLTIDGKEVQVPKGTNVIEAARKIGIDIPYLCYHHQLTAYGGCRLCLVEIEKVPKLLAACNTTVADGMVVRTSSDKVKSQRAGTLEFILLNHPLDCPICDKGGECELQDRTFEHSNALSRMTERKVHIQDYDLGPLMVRNQDRCIICKRCIKVMEEIVGDPVLEFGQRGVSTEVYTFEHEHFKPGFSGNTIRVCPVGALMSKPFRFTARPWELIKTPSVCSLCSVGCNLREDVRENKLLRVVGLENPAVNDGWLCDRGQFGYDYINSPDRVKAPMIRRDNGQLEETSWDEALNLIAERLKGVMANGSAFAALGSDRASNEDNFALQRFTREVMASPNIDHRMGGTGTGYAARRPQPGAIEALPKADVVLILASDLTAEAPVLDLVLKRSLLPKQMKAIVAYPRATALDKFSHQQLRYTPGQETALVNALVKAASEAAGGDAAKSADATGFAQATGSGSVSDLAAAAGVTEAEVRAAAATFAGAKLGSVIYGQAAAESSQGAAFVAAIQNLALVAGQAGKPGHVRLEAVQNANSWGARDMGVLPDTLPGGGAPKQKGMATGEILAAAGGGKLQALWVMQSNPAVDFPDAARAKKALESIPFLVVTDLFLTETAELAHVVLPVVSVAERNCTLTNVEGRVQKAVRAMDPRGAAKEDWKILTMLAEDLGSSLGYSTAEAVGKDVRAAYAGAAAARAPAMAKAEAPAAAKAGGDLPLKLFTGKLMFDRSTIQGRSTVLPGLAGDPFVELHEDDAKRLGVAAGDTVEVATAQGSLKLAAKVSRGVALGSAFVPSGFNEAPVAGLMTEGSTVAACRITVGAKAAAKPETTSEREDEAERDIP